MDIIMEKTKNLTMSEEEKAEFNRKELKGKVKGLVQKFLDDLISLQSIRLEMESEKMKHPAEAEEFLKGELLERLEPDENNLAALEDNLNLNDIKNVEIIPAALAGKSGLRDFYISTDTHNHSLFKVLAPQITKTAKVKASGLADFLNEQGIEETSLLKLDIEGAEYEVLNNFTDWQKVKNIILEYHDFGDLKHAQLENLLQDNGYKIKITPSKFEQGLGFIIGTK